MNAKIKKDDGFTTVDIGIAMMIVIVFVSIMTSMLYSVYSSSTEAKRTAVALNYAVDIFEEIGKEAYSNVSEDSILRSIKEVNIGTIVSQGEGNGTNAKIGTYDINLKIVDPYGDNKLKLVTLTITYPVSAKNTEKIELQRLKTAV